MREIYFNKEPIATVDPNWIDFLKRRARSTPLRRSRLCVHRAHDEPVQEMLIAMCDDVLFRPHRHIGKTESYHIVEGELHLVVFDDHGKPELAVHMGPASKGLVFYYRLCEPRWHAMLPITDMVVVHETTTGPFVPGDAPFAPFAPEEPSELRRFLVDSIDDARARHRSAASAPPITPSEIESAQTPMKSR